MPIQFRCSGCGQPIEVDDEHAGKMAACPYCQRVVAVPQTSTFDGGPITPARPAGQPMDAGRAALPPGPIEPVETGARHETARRFGRYALISLALAIASMVAMVAMSWPTMMEMLKASAAKTGQVSGSQLSQIQSDFLHAMQNRPAFVALNYAGEILVVVALALSITSVAQARRRNTPGVVALVVSGLLTLCICGSVLASLAGFASAA
jgi:DNA-directed RNA polymerase subunit RPC12/RpoP